MNPTRLIIRDYFIRRWWIWLIGLPVNAFFTWLFYRLKSDDSLVSFPLIIFLGSFPLMLDLQKGCTRAILTLPISTKELANIWRWEAVALPFIACFTVNTIVFLYCCISQGTWNHTPSFLLYNFVNLLALGVMFFALTGMSGKGRQSGESFLERTKSGSFNFFWGLTYTGIYLFPKLGQLNPTARILMTVTAIILTVWGWFRAELLVGQRAGFRLSIQKGGQTKDNQDSVARRGGLIFLIQHLMKQTLLIGAWFVGSAVIFIWLSRDPLSAHAKTIPEMITGNPILFSMLIVMVGLQIFPVCLQMRFFRTLPLSTNDLAAFLVLTTLSCILMIFASVVFVLVVVFQQSLVSVIQSIPKSSCAIMLLLIPVVVWSGWGRKSNMVLFLGIAAAQVYSFFWEHDHWRSNSQTVSFVGAALVVPVAFLLTKIAIERSSRTYRPRTVSPDGSIWGRDM